jgi:hypothetical protein
LPVRSPSVVLRRVTVVAGLAATANGVALVAHILGRIPLPLILTVCWVVGILTVAAMMRIGGPGTASHLGRLVRIGAVAAVAATVVYDVANALLSTADPSPYNPFEALLFFGQALIGSGQPDALTRGVGLAFHLANGVTFGIAFTLLFGPGRSLPRAVLAGIAWGVFLETFQLALYPGWLSVKFLAEFQSISFLSHVAFGATLGALAHRWITSQQRRVSS